MEGNLTPCPRCGTMVETDKLHRGRGVRMLWRAGKLLQTTAERKGIRPETVTRITLLSIIDTVDRITEGIRAEQEGKTDHGS